MVSTTSSKLCVEETAGVGSLEETQQNLFFTDIAKLNIFWSGRDHALKNSAPFTPYYSYIIVNFIKTEIWYMIYVGFRKPKNTKILFFMSFTLCYWLNHIFESSQKVTKKKPAIKNKQVNVYVLYLRNDVGVLCVLYWTFTAIH